MRDERLETKTKGIESERHPQNTVDDSGRGELGLGLGLRDVGIGRTSLGDMSSEMKMGTAPASIT